MMQQRPSMFIRDLQFDICLQFFGHIGHYYEKIDGFNLDRKFTSWSIRTFYGVWASAP